MDESSAFRQAIMDDPLNDVPRLVYADWLEERGDPRGEFIRLQCELAMDQYDETWIKLKEREKALLAAHEEQWIKEDTKDVPALRENFFLDFRRGFIGSVEPRHNTLSWEDADFVDEQIKYLADHFPIESFDLTNSNITDNGSNITDNGLVQVAAAFPNLRSLYLNNTGITDEGLKCLSALTKLDVLSLRDTHITDEGLKCLSALTKLYFLGLHNTHITGGGLKHIAGMERLESLDLSLTNLTDDGLKHIAGMERLKSLNLSRTNLTDDWLKHIAGMKELKSLNLEMTHLTDDGLAQITAALPQLRSLYLDNTGITDEGLKHLPGMTELRALSLGGRSITGEGLKHIAGMGRLKRLYLTRGDRVTLSMLSPLSKLKNLKMLSFPGNAEAEDGRWGDEAYRWVINNFPKLQRIHINGFWRTPDELRTQLQDGQEHEQRNWQGWVSGGEGPADDQSPQMRR